MKHGHNVKTIVIRSWKSVLSARSVFALLLFALSISLNAAEPANGTMAGAETKSSGTTSAETKNADESKDAPVTQQIADLKDEVIDLNRDLFILEEELLFPASTQTAVFLSMDVGKFFSLDSVELKIDDHTVTNYLYTDRQVDALHRGGMQRLWVGNLRTGKHEISAFFIGKGPEGRDYRRAASLTFEKTTDPKRLELRISDSTEKYQPVFQVVEWK